MGKGARAVLGAALFAAIPLVGVADLLSGVDLGFSPFYAAPVAALAWEFGMAHGLVAAALSGAAWAIADHINRPGLDLAAGTWNTALRVLGLVTLAYLLAAVRRSQNDLRVALSQRDEFLSLVAHELRAPVAAIEIVATALARSAVPQTEQRSALAQLLEQSRDLRTLAEDVLSIGRLEAGVERVEVETFDLIVLAGEVASRGDRVRLDPARPSSVVVRADRRQVRRALTNVVDNALKFSKDAPVELAVAEADGWATVRIADHGIGLAADEAAQLFEKYARIDHPVVRRTPGVGLGLYLTRLLLRVNGGSIEARSPGRGLGSTFLIRLPMHPSRHRTGAAIQEGSGV